MEGAWGGWGSEGGDEVGPGGVPCLSATGRHGRADRSAGGAPVLRGARPGAGTSGGPPICWTDGMLWGEQRVFASIPIRITDGPAVENQSTSNRLQHIFWDDMFLKLPFAKTWARLPIEPRSIGVLNRRAGPNHMTAVWRC